MKERKTVRIGTGRSFVRWGRRIAAAILAVMMGIQGVAVLTAPGKAEATVTQAGNVLLETDTIQISLKNGNLLSYALPHRGDSEIVRAEFTLLEILLGGQEKEVSSWTVTGLLEGEVPLEGAGAWKLRALVTDGILEEWGFSEVLYLSNEMKARQNEVLLEADMTLEAGAFEGSGITAIRLYEGLEAIPERAFADSALEWIYIPATVTIFADSAFDGCTAALIICTPENSPAAMFAQENGISLEIE